MLAINKMEHKFQNNLAILFLRSTNTLSLGKFFVCYLDREQANKCSQISAVNLHALGLLTQSELLLLQLVVLLNSLKDRHQQDHHRHHQHMRDIKLE